MGGKLFRGLVIASRGGGAKEGIGGEFKSYV